ncbi:MAG: glycosyltransferase [Rhodobacterales bacterium]|nr:glycosyltransferase [Rhodobacterales bacterium]
MDVLFYSALISLVVWIGMLLFHGRFWRADQVLDEDAAPAAFPPVAVVIPARDEAPTIGRVVAALAGQDYAGPVHIVVVDDNSTDGTADAARAGAGEGALTVVPGRPLEAGWTGKLWAVHQGLAAAAEAMPDAAYVLLTDADILHDPGSLRRLVAKARADGLDLVSLMVRLRAESRWEKLLIPAFVFFFQKLYPFPRVNDPRSPVAAAAGGCMLARRAALDAAGGVAPIRDRVIDDCALARLLKARGPIWLGLTDRVVSLRAYESLGEIWSMVARTAYVQLRRSPLLLLGTVAAMAVLYLAPPVAALVGATVGDRITGFAGLAGWAAMAWAYRPTLRLYDEPALNGFLLPLAGVLYTAMTVDSARRHWAGRGAGWKGRHYDPPG